MALSEIIIMQEKSVELYQWKNTGISYGFDDLRSYLSKNSIQVSSESDTNIFIKKLNMCAAIWSVLYPNDRDFDTTWLEIEYPVSGLCFSDAAENGFYSTYAEGLIVKFLYGSGVILPLNILAVTEKESGIWGVTLTRESIVTQDVSQDDWENLLADIEKKFSQGMYSSDLRFIRQAINWLRNGGPIKGGVCSKLTPEFA